MRFKKSDVQMDIDIYRVAANIKEYFIKCDCVDVRTFGLNCRVVMLSTLY